MKLYKIEAGNFKLDGGAMFGVVPKSIWNKTNPADENNLIDMATRCLLIEDGKRLILVDTGMGNKQNDKFFSYYFRYGNYELIKSIRAHGFSENDITDVFLSHLHFDHCGGVASTNGDITKINFPNAKIWTNHSHWDWATEPNVREAPSFRKDNLDPILQSGQLSFVDFDENYTRQQDFPFDIICVDGHTEKQMLPKIEYKDHTIVFMADLIPTTGHIPTIYTMGYDTRPLLTMQEKNVFLEKAAKNNYLLFLEHDAQHELCTVVKTEKGFALNEIVSLSEI